MPTFTSLPPELILSILTHLSDPTLAALARTNKAFPPLINPLLYRTADWYLHDNKEDDQNNPLLDWFRTLCERPDLAALVKHVIFTSELENWEPDVYADCFTASDKRRFDEGVSLLGAIPFEEELRSGVETGNDDALKAVILSKLHNLEVLEIDYSLAHKFKFTGLMLQNALSGSLNSSKFGKLKRIHLRNDRDVEAMRYDVNFELLFSVFHVPSLETIEMVLPEPPDPVWIESLSGRSLTNLGTLRLMNSEASVKTLSKILAITPNLHTLEYNFVQDLDKVRFDEYYEEGHYDEWYHLTTALNQIRRTLRDLTISVSYHYDEYCHDTEDQQELDLEWVDRLWERRGCMDSLQSFTKLERLEIPLPVLLGWSPNFPHKGLKDVLPCSLKELFLRDDFVDLYKGYTSPWVPWESDGREAIENRDWAFQTSVQCEPVIETLRDYLSSNHDNLLKTLAFKQIQGRHWPDHYLETVAQLCRDTNIKGAFLMQATNEGDEVIETTVYDPMDTRSRADEGCELLRHQYRYVFLEGRRTFYHRYCATTPEWELREAWDNLIWDAGVEYV